MELPFYVYPVYSKGQYNDHRRRQHQHLEKSSTTTEERKESIDNGIRRAALSSVFDELSSQFDRDSQTEKSLFAQLLDSHHGNTVY